VLLDADVNGHGELHVNPYDGRVHREKPRDAGGLASVNTLTPVQYTWS